MDPITTSILCSLFADISYDSVKSMLDLNKTIDSKLEKCFKNALRQWSVPHKERENYQIENYSTFLQFLYPESSAPSKEIQELGNLFKKEVLQDDACSKYVLHLKIDRLLASQDKKPAIYISEEEFRKNNDTGTIKMLLEAFDFDMMDEFCRESPDSFNCDIVTCCEIWSMIIGASSYRIYNPELDERIKSVFIPWAKAIDLGKFYYFPEPGTDRYHFHRLRYGAFPTEEAKAAYLKLKELRKQIYPNLRRLSSCIKDYYCIDPKEYAMKGFQRLELPQ